MEVNVRDSKKMVDVWLTNAEKNDPQIQAQLKDIYAQYKKKKIWWQSTSLVTVISMRARWPCLLTTKDGWRNWMCSARSSGVML
ncbi:MAG: hypothetical protein LUE21_04885 [Oscillospiraceae bacterium]|nr:hypothetical protein [Oscillospiraceae bacterium]